jgi:hypothetical protein
MLKKAWLLAPVLSIGCFPYVYHKQERVLVRGIDIDATLEVAKSELEEGGFDATLPIWAMRDQVLTPGQARSVSALYFEYIDRVSAQKDRTVAEFGVWHFTWAISNLYRNGDDAIQVELLDAYSDAVKRPARLKKFKDIASEHVNGSQIYMGDIHGPARSFARSHIVAPGNAKYLQSLEEYRQKTEKKS